MVRAVFLDRDGVITEDTGYPHEIDKIRFLARASEAIKVLNDNGFKVIVVTNQAGVARGYFTEETVKEINKYVQESLVKRGARIDRIYYCPHHIDGTVAKYRKECQYRKPNPGMIEQAVREFNIDLEASFIIGDSITDIETGYRAGCRSILLSGQEEPKRGKRITPKPDYIATDLYEAVQWIAKSNKQNG